MLSAHFNQTQEESSLSLGSMSMCVLIQHTWTTVMCRVKAIQNLSNHYQS